MDVDSSQMEDTPTRRTRKENIYLKGLYQITKKMLSNVYAQRTLRTEGILIPANYLLTQKTRKPSRERTNHQKLKGVGFTYLMEDFPIM